MVGVEHPSNDSDVGSPYPGAEEGPKGLAVRQLKSYASWVQTVHTLISVICLEHLTLSVSKITLSVIKHH